MSSMLALSDDDVDEIGMTIAYLKRALKAITGCDSVPPSHRGNIELMAADWLEWGKSRGYVQP